MSQQVWLAGTANGSDEPHAPTNAAVPRRQVSSPAIEGRPPRTSVPVVERRHLLRWITRSVEQVPLTLIRAPAGTGKTVLVAAWAFRRSQSHRPVAWLGVTARDNHPAVFRARLQVCLTLAGVLPAPAGSQPRVPNDAAMDALDAPFTGLDAPAVIVVDGADRLRNPKVHDQVRHLLDAGGDRLRIVMTSRVEPLLPIQRYRVENRVAELGVDGLALRREEIEQVLVRHHVQASNGICTEVLRQTEGWAAGVRLAALRLAADGAIQGLDGFAAPYVREEIVSGLSPLEREVLTATAAVDELPPGLARAVTGRSDADALIHMLATGNAFVLPVRGRPGTFRLHTLVREVLRADLAQGSPGRSSAVHRRAAAWFDDRGELEAAVRHAAAAGDWQTAATRVVEGRGLAEVILGTTTGAALAEDLASLPETGSPDVTLLRAAIALRDGDLERARTALDRAGAQPGIAASVVRTAWCDAAGRPTDALAAAREARSRLEDAHRPDPLVTAVVATAEGAAQLRAGDLDAASAALREAVSATTGIDGPLRLRCLAELAFAQACAGHLTRALALADAAEQAAVDERVPVASRPLVLELARVWVAVERQELRQAQRSLNRMGRTRAGRDDDTWRTTLLLLRSRYLRDRGDLPGARRHLGQAASTPGSAPEWLRDQVKAESHGLDTDQQAPGPWTALGDQGRVQELLDEADHRCRVGDVAAARADVGRALQLGRTERLRRPFTHASPMVRSLIRNDAQVSAMAGWLRPGLPGENDASPTTEPVLEHLSDRELEVLRHLAAFLTTEEIAGAMFISVNTVRTHVRRVLEKLSVSRRYEAVRRGQELGLV